MNARQERKKNNDKGAHEYNHRHEEGADDTEGADTRQKKKGKKKERKVKTFIHFTNHA